MKNAKPKEKQTQTKTSSTKSTPTSKSDCSDCITLGHIGGFLASVALIVGVLYGGHHLIFGPNLEVGDCAVSGDYRFFEVSKVDTEYDYYTLVEQEPKEASLYGAYFLNTKWDDNFEKNVRDRDFETVHEKYNEIPCYKD